MLWVRVQDLFMLHGATAQDAVIRDEPYHKIWLCAIGQSAGFGNALWAIAHYQLSQRRITAIFKSLLCPFKGQWWLQCVYINSTDKGVCHLKFQIPDIYTHKNLVSRSFEFEYLGEFEVNFWNKLGVKKKGTWGIFWWTKPQVNNRIYRPFQEQEFLRCRKQGNFRDYRQKSRILLEIYYKAGAHIIYRELDV